MATVKNRKKAQNLVRRYLAWAAVVDKTDPKAVQQYKRLCRTAKALDVTTDCRARLFSPVWWEALARETGVRLPDEARFHDLNWQNEILTREQEDPC